MIWKEYPSNPRYQVSNNGWVYDNKRNCYQKFFINKDGYYSFGTKGKVYLVHRIVAETFLGMSNLQIHHINHDKLDNQIENLRYVTRKEHIELHPEIYFQKGHRKYSDTWFKLGNIPKNKKQVNVLNPDSNI